MKFSSLLFQSAQNKSQHMITKISSQKEIGEESQLNAEVKEDSSSDQTSLKANSIHPERESSASKEKLFARKPNAQNSNLQTFKLIRRKSQQKVENDNQNNKMEQPPKHPKSTQQIKQERSNTQITGPSTQVSCFSSMVAEEEPIKSDSTVRFKKKAMSKEQIIEVKAFIQRGEHQKFEVNSIPGSQKGAKDEISEELIKEANKKSKTQYYNFEQVHGSPHNNIDIPENSSQSDKIYIAALTQKCKSADQTKHLLNKRVKWLREEVQMHLERQLEFKKIQQALEKQIKEKDVLLIQEQQKNDQVEKELQSKIVEINKLKNFIIELNKQYDCDRNVLVEEIQFLKEEKDEEVQEVQKKYQEKISQLEVQIEELKKENSFENEGQFKKEQSSLKTHYPQQMIQKIMEENKYLKMENHILARCKEDLNQLKKTNRQVTNERDTLKKKIIENAKKEAMRMRMLDDSDSYATVNLTELSYSISHSKN